MIHKNTKFFALVILLVLVAAIIAYVGMVYLIETHQANLSERREAQAQAEARRSALSALVRTVENSKQEREELNARIVTEAQVIDLLSLIETIGKEQGIILTTQSLSSGPLSGSFELLTIRLSAEGDYDGIMRVIRMLEALPYQSTIQSVTLNIIESEEGDVGWKGTLNLSVTKFAQT